MGTQAPDPRKHHYIPEFYLRRWTGADGKFERYTRPIPGKITVKRVFPSEAGFARDLYRLPGTDSDPMWLETRILQRIDDRAARVLNKLNLATPATLTDEELSSWSVFVRSLFYRAPDMLRAVKESGEHDWYGAIEEMRAQYPIRRRATDPECFDDFVASHSREDIERSVMGVLPTLFTSQRIGQFLNDLHKRVIDTPPHVPTFLLSDEPLARTNGMMNESGHYAIPLSPRRLLVAAYTRKTLDVIVNQGEKRLVTSVNRWIVESARHFVAGVDRTQDRFIRNRFGIDLKSPVSQRVRRL